MISLPGQDLQRWINESKRRLSGEVDAVAMPGQLASDQVRRDTSWASGRAKGEKEFYEDPIMQRLAKQREDLAKGYSGEELGAIRETARGELRGAAADQQRRLASSLGRGGVGGARAAAMQGAAGSRNLSSIGDVERKMALDSAQMKRSGIEQLQDFEMKRKQGALGTAAIESGLASSDYAALMAKNANSAGGGKK